MSYVLALFAIAAGPAVQPSIFDDIAGSSLFWPSVEILLGSIAMFIANKYGVKEWKAAAVVGMFGIAISFIAVLCSRSSLSLIHIIVQSMPIIAVTAWMISASYFRYRVNQEFAAQKQSIAAIGNLIGTSTNLHEQATNIAGHVIKFVEEQNQAERRINDELSKLNSRIDSINHM